VLTASFDNANAGLEILPGNYSQQILTPYDLQTNYWLFSIPKMAVQTLKDGQNVIFPNPQRIIWNRPDISGEAHAWSSLIGS